MNDTDTLKLFAENVLFVHSYNLTAPKVSLLLLVLILSRCGETHPIAPAPPAPAASTMVDVSQKLDMGLRALMEAARTKDAGSVERAAKAQSIPITNGMVSVKITADKVPDVGALEKVVSDAGGKVTTKLSVVIFALVQPQQIEKIAADIRVWNITIPARDAHPM